jgi:hypothetical protein
MGILALSLAFENSFPISKVATHSPVLLMFADL